MYSGRMLLNKLPGNCPLTSAIAIAIDNPTQTYSHEREQLAKTAAVQEQFLVVC